MKTLTAISAVCAASASLMLVSGPVSARTLRGPAARPPAPPPPSAVVPRPALAPSLKAIEASFAEARKAGISVSCAVLDVHGDLVAFGRMDDAPFLTIGLAEGKALASVLFGIPSRDLGRMSASPLFASLNASVHDRMVPAQGALPLLRGRHLIGAIGCSGGAPPQDEAAARAGRAVF